MKSMDPTRPAKKTVLNTLSYIYRTNGLKGLYRGVAPRIGLGEHPLESTNVRRVANHLHGQLCGLCQGCVSPYLDRANGSIGTN
jgi:hypothetical protein